MKRRLSAWNSPGLMLKAIEKNQPSRLCWLLSLSLLSWFLLFYFHVVIFGEHSILPISAQRKWTPETLDYIIFFVDNSGKKVSPWHDIPLQIQKRQTSILSIWEDPSFANSEAEGALGDNDPVDVVEIGEHRGKVGEILKVKPLSALAMIDEGELDWKIVAISLDDPRASLVNDIDDVDKHFPGTLTAIRNWFRDYKIPDGKPANKFGLGNKAANKDYALKVITETNESWAKLVKRSIPNGDLSLL
ncbi:hypothetical protein NE237_022095 [Protea cynaroides]|uniref:inorganic diphosphatase n=1 Tax=Protea cynaroides TaxID=273540 RepID=A0A9Q0HBE1_9MAGN|nr:hypothetical protein NE237_022095 [Protea cynaroides]